jgi:hypothetical protein
VTGPLLTPFPPSLAITLDREFAMKTKIVTGITMLLIALPALADEAVAAAVPKFDGDPTALIVSAALFVGMIGGFFFYLWRKDSGDKKSGAE